MPEYSPVDERFQNMRSEISRLAERRKDVPYFGSFWVAYDELLDTDPQVRDATYKLVEELHRLNPVIKGDQAFNDAYIIHKSIQTEEVRRFSNTYPIDRKFKEGWYPTFKRLANDKDYLEDVAFNLCLPIASTVPDRFVLFRFALAAAGIQGPMRLVEYGCGLNINLAKWALVDLHLHGLSYPPFKVIQPQGPFSAEESETPQGFVENLQDSVIFNGLVRGGALGIELGVGLDAMNAKADDNFRRWGESNSRRPADYRNPSFNREQSILLNYENHPDSIAFFGAFYDIPLNFERLKKKVGENQFHAVLISNTLYQNSEEAIHIAIANAEKLAPKGLIAVFESRKFTSSIKAPNGKPLFPQATEAHSELDYSLFVKDMRRPRAGFMQCLLVNDPRPSQVMILPHTSDLAL